MTQRCLQPPQGAAAEAAARYSAVIPRLETERLILRVPCMDDFPVWEEIHVQHFGSDSERAWDEFSAYTACWMLHGHGLMSVTRKDDGAIVGFVLLGMEWGDPEPELGWMLTDTARGQGYATEAARALRDLGLDLLGPGGFVSYIDQGNHASQAVAARLGARPEGTKPEWDSAIQFRHGVQ